MNLWADFDRPGQGMKIATFNINNIKKRFDSLLVWAPSRIELCPQELETRSTGFPRVLFANSGAVAWEAFLGEVASVTHSSSP